MTEPVPSSTGRTVAITGASGLIGSALTAALLGRGDQVIHLVRRAPRVSGAALREVRWDPGSDLEPAALAGVDAVVHLAGAGIGDKRWDSERKQELISSRLDGTGTISRAVAARPDPPRLLSASAVGFYGDRGEEVLTEVSSGGEGFLAQLSRDWEAATWPARRTEASVAMLRTGIVLSREGGALGRLLPLLRLGLAGKLGNGRQYWSWITLHDHVRAVLFLSDHPEITGPVNLTGPAPATQSEVVKALASQARRPSFVPAPTLALRLVLGEMAGEILGSQRVLPTRLTGAGFTFDHSDLESAARWVLAPTA
ncbi:TIGR01777 family oxidoreductase [Ornithinimicrobium panacihumi]|uniref:TIGR01777 family oxidoreductase n=1 Tax=Ornithinimicrobium panacihumi TaxID=2008449 RepID=UPI003F8B0A3D